MFNENLIKKIKEEISCLKSFFYGFGNYCKIKEIFQLEEDFEKLLAGEDSSEVDNVVVFEKVFKK